MRRSPRVVLAWLVTFAVALTTARVVGGDLASLHRRAAALGPLREVVVATRDIPLGETITARDLATERRYARELPREAVGDAASAVGRVVAVPVLRDAILFRTHLAPASRNGLDGIVPAGERAMHVTAHDGFQPARGAVVDVLAAFDPTAVTVSGAGDAAVIVASGAVVVAVDGGSASTDDVHASAAGVTLLVTEAEARAIAFAASTGDLSLVIAPPESACCEASSP